MLSYDLYTLHKKNEFLDNQAFNRASEFHMSLGN